MIESWAFQKKMTVAFSVMVALVILTSAIGVYALHRTIATEKDQVNLNAEGMIQAGRLDAAFSKESASFRGYVAAPDESFLREQVQYRQEFVDTVPRVERTIYTEDGLEIVRELSKAHDAWTQSTAHVLALLKGKNGHAEAIRAMEMDTLPLKDRITQMINTLIDKKRQLYAQVMADAASQAANASLAIIFLGALAVIFAAANAMLLGRSLSKQVGAAVQHVLSSSSELQSGANQQSSGAKETATAINEISTTVSELLVTSRQIAASAQQVTHIAEDTLKAAGKGDQTVVQSREAIAGIRRQVDIVVNHMLDLGKKSQQIGSVLDIVNELAEQTNILSINASIEAAGAGEQGKRFAVVGEEIRKLAERVSASTKDSRGLLEEVRAAVNTTILATEAGSKAVDAGLDRFEEVSRGLQEIAAMVATATQAAREIGLSTKQQMSAVEQVNSAIGGAATATRQTEAGSVQMLQTATQLAQLSHNLSCLVQTRATA